MNSATIKFTPNEYYLVEWFMGSGAEETIRSYGKRESEFYDSAVTNDKEKTLTILDDNPKERKLFDYMLYDIEHQIRDMNEEEFDTDTLPAVRRRHNKAVEGIRNKIEKLI